MKPLIKTLKTKITKTLLALVLTLCLATGITYGQFYDGETHPTLSVDPYCKINYENFTVFSGWTGSSSCNYKAREMMRVATNGTYFGSLDEGSKIFVDEICSRSSRVGENCKDISEGWEAEAAQSAIEWNEILNIPADIADGDDNSEAISKNSTGDFELIIPNHAGEDSFISEQEKFVFSGQGSRPFDFQKSQIQIDSSENIGEGIKITEGGKQLWFGGGNISVNDVLQINAPKKVSIVSPEIEIIGNLTATGKVCDISGKCIGECDNAPATSEVPNGTLCGFCQKTGTTFSADVAGENYETVACESKRDPCVQGCPDGWKLQLLFGNRHSCVKQ